MNPFVRYFLPFFLGSGYSTPISKEGSPRNSAYLEVYQPPIQPSVVGSAFEGKAVSEIFRLVEEERKSLEANLASLTKVCNLFIFREVLLL